MDLKLSIEKEHQAHLLEKRAAHEDNLLWTKKAKKIQEECHTCSKEKSHIHKLKVIEHKEAHDIKKVHQEKVAAHQASKEMNVVKHQIENSIKMTKELSATDKPKDSKDTDNSNKMQFEMNDKMSSKVIPLKEEKHEEQAEHEMGKKEGMQDFSWNDDEFGDEFKGFD